LFYRGGVARASAARGAGLGLAFVRELVERRGGKIEVCSPAFPQDSPVRGSCFTMTLPIERVSGVDENDGAPAVMPARSAPVTVPADTGAEAASRPTLLIIDDNADLRRLLRDEFEESHIVLDAADGARGLALALEHAPDCVIADVMMPELDGEALCSRLKANELTAHIPVILLTARGSRESELRGLSVGADDYVAKPVSFAVLRARVQNLIAGRARLRERFGQQVFLAPQEVAITPVDEQFIRRALRVVEEHMSDAEFDVEQFARAMGLSRASLFRKFKGISGQSPSEFIRRMRLERARGLLSNGQLNVSQTAAEVGFLDLSHFAACFRKQFGVSPSECAKAGINAAAISDRGARSSPAVQAKREG
jgi:DNA-binding response OmpR family regulator